MQIDYLPYQLDDAFIEDFAASNVDPFSVMDDNGLAAATVARTYLRNDNPRLEPGQMESWLDVCRRVIEGMVSFKYEWFIETNLENRDHPRWSFFDNQYREQEKGLAEKMFTSLYHLLWSPPGRGMHMMGTEFVNGRHKVEALQNCAFRSTQDAGGEHPGEVFGNIMDLLMMGVGVGFDTNGAGARLFVPRADLVQTIAIEDSREGWAGSVERLVGSYLSPGSPTYSFIYNGIRPAGAPIRGFGGVASGPEPLEELHRRIRSTLDNREGGVLSSTDIVDTSNQIGACVVAGNVRRSAQIALGNPGDEAFVALKDYESNPDRQWGWVSNNSVVYDKPAVPTDAILEQTLKTGEPGYVFRYNFARGRMGNEPIDEAVPADRAEGLNPCGEIPLEDGEMCTLAEVYLPRINLDDYKEQAFHAYTYAKVVTLANRFISNDLSREVMMRNRRIGIGVTGVTQAIAKYGEVSVWKQLNETYMMLRGVDIMGSKQMGVPVSKRLTTIKPSGTMSTVANVTSGIHYAIKGRYYLRAMRIAATSPLVPLLTEGGYHIEDAIDSANTKVVYFPVDMGPNALDADEVDPDAHLSVVVSAQRHWSDNGVSVTITLPERTTLEDLRGLVVESSKHLKSVAFLPAEHGYEQAPYTRLTAEEYETYTERLTPFSLEMVEHTTLHTHDMDDLGCEGEACEVRPVD